MDIAKLQQGLSELSHLLPLQQDWFTRLLFQLSFNDFAVIQTLGAASSGKSTLTLALAELLSAQANVALITAVPEQHVITAIQQQWFGQHGDSTDLSVQVAEYKDEQPLYLIIDDGQNYSAALLQQMIALSIPCFIFATKPVVPEALTLTINQAGLEDAEQLLAAKNLPSEQLLKCVEQAQGDLTLLKNGRAAPNGTRSQASQAATSKPGSIVLMSIAVATLLVLGLVLSYVNFGANPAKQTTLVLEPDLTRQSTAIIKLPNKPAEPELPMVELQPEVNPLATSIIEPLGVKEDGESEEASSIPPLNGNDTEVQNEAVVNDQAAEDITVRQPVAVESTPEPAVNKAIAPVSTKNTELATEATIAQADKVAVKCHSEQLLTANSTEVALQLAVLSKLAAFNQLQAQYPSLSMSCYQRSWQGKRQLVVLLGPFSDKQGALSAQTGLPKQLASSGSFIKSIKAIQAEITAFNISQQLSAID